MNRSKRIRPVVELAESRERDAAQRFGQCQQNHAAQRDKLQELIAYRDDYSSRLSGQRGFQLTSSQLQEYQRFLQRLNEAIDHQCKVVEQARQDRERGRAGWMERHAHHKALDKVEQRYRDAELRQDERRLQRELDDRGARKTDGED